MHRKLIPFIVLAPAVGFALPVSADILDGRNFHPVEADIRTVPAVGFFPLGGTLSIKSTQLSSYALGISLDLLNFTDHRTLQRLSLLNVGGYLIGLNYVALAKDDPELQPFSVAYCRVGPHYRWPGMWDRKVSVGGQLGYGLLLFGDTVAGRTSYLHGVDISFTLSWSPARELTSH